MNGNYNARMLALRYVYILALGVWRGGMVVLGALAQTLLRRERGRDLPAGWGDGI